VVIDSSPLGEVSDALPVARQVDDVILVARPRHTDRASLQVARDLLHRAGVLPRGLVLVGETLHETSSSYYMRALTSTGKEPVRTRGSAPA
jgi:Mrp family chromosome partitioning ATPase